MRNHNMFPIINSADLVKEAVLAVKAGSPVLVTGDDPSIFERAKRDIGEKILDAAHVPDGSQILLSDELQSKHDSTFGGVRQIAVISPERLENTHVIIGWADNLAFLIRSWAIARRCGHVHAFFVISPPANYLKRKKALDKVLLLLKHFSSLADADKMQVFVHFIMVADGMIAQNQTQKGGGHV